MSFYNFFWKWFLVFQDLMFFTNTIRSFSKDSLVASLLYRLISMPFRFMTFVSLLSLHNTSHLMQKVILIEFLFLKININKNLTKLSSVNRIHQEGLFGPRKYISIPRKFFSIRKKCLHMPEKKLFSTKRQNLFYLPE